MTLRDYARKHGRIAREHGAGAAAQSALGEAGAKGVLRPLLAAKQRKLSRTLTNQSYLLEELRARDQWTLLIFDAGRYDYLKPLLADHYRGDVQRTFSAARDTFEWITKAWQGDFDDVTYISGMVPVSDEIPDFDAEDFKRLYDGINPGDSIGDIHKLWETHWDDSVATVPPEDITDYALDYVDRDKLVVHYNQPHSPFIGTPQLLGHTEGHHATPKKGRPNDEPIWHRVRTGDVSDAHLRMAYWSNAARAIAAAKPLVEARDTVVATSDHGEALGEWGIYTHDRAPHPKRRVVPWMEIDSVREQAAEEQMGRSDDVDGKLQALGYL